VDNIYHAKGYQKKAGVAVLISDKIDIKIDCNKRQRALSNNKGDNPK